MRISSATTAFLSAIGMITGTSDAFSVPQQSSVTPRSSFSAVSRNPSGRRYFESKPLYGFFQDLFKPTPEAESKLAAPPKPLYDPVTIDPDFRVAGLFLVAGFLLDLIPYIQILLGLPVTALGILFLVQTFRIRFIFDEDNAIELVNTKGLSGELEESGENVVVGGANRWNCDTIVNYDFFPEGWIDQPQGPILVYFKETTTPQDKWNEGPGEMANKPEKIASGEAVPGQVHFFPAVCNAQQIRDEFVKRGCKKI